MTKQVRRSNVAKGVLVPLGNGFSLAIGKHPEKTDDIDIGPNNKNGLSVNHGEILQQKGDSLRVFSAEPMLGGESPAQLLYRGANPNAVFAAQEHWKDVHKINDDGTKQAQYGKKVLRKVKDKLNNIISPLKEEEKQKNEQAIDWSGIKTTNNRSYDSNYIDYINKGLISRGVGKNQRAAIIANIIEESGGNPFAIDSTKKFKGLLQWEESRYWPGNEKDVYKEIDNQLDYIVNTAGNATDKKSWTHGGKGSGYNSLTDAMAAYNNEDDLEATMKGYTLGYVRPAGGINSYNNRLKVAQQLNALKGFAFGGQIIKQSLGERPNAKFRKEMNKRKNALNGSSIDPFMGYGRKLPDIPFTLTRGVNGYLTPQFKPIEVPKLDIGMKSAIPQVDPFMGMKPVATNKPSTVTSSGGNKGGITAKGMDWIGGGIQTLGNLAAAGIQQAAINNMKVTPHQYTLLNPVKLKTKVNVAPQVAAMKDTVAKLTDAARRTSASSRTMYQKTLDARRYGDQQISGLLGEKENKETALINQDRLNQQTIAEKNANRVMNTINGNTDRESQLKMEKDRLTANNWIGAINNEVAILDGPQGVFARQEARRSQAANLAMMSMAYPDAARLMRGDNWTHAFDGYYNMLNSRGGRGNGWRI